MEQYENFFDIEIKAWTHLAKNIISRDQKIPEKLNTNRYITKSDYLEDIKLLCDKALNLKGDNRYKEKIIIIMAQKRYIDYEENYLIYRKNDNDKIILTEVFIRKNCDHDIKEMHAILDKYGVARLQDMYETTKEDIERKLQYFRNRRIYLRITRTVIALLVVIGILLVLLLFVVWFICAITNIILLVIFKYRGHRIDWQEWLIGVTVSPYGLVHNIKKIKA